MLTNVLEGKGGINARFLHGENLPVESPTWDPGEYFQACCSYRPGLDGLN